MRNIILFILHLLIVKGLHSQNHAARMVKDNQKVVLRIVPLNEKAWLQNLKGAYQIEIFKLAHTRMEDTAKLRDILPLKTIKLKPLAEENWPSIMTKNQKAALLYNTLKLKEQQKQNKQQIKILMGLSLVLCDADSSLARAYGLLYESDYDPEILYRIQPLNQLNKNDGKCFYISHLIHAEKINASVQEFKVVAKKNVVQTEWNSEKSKNDFAVYNLERSFDKKIFYPVNKDPIVPIHTQYETNKSHCSYYDTIVKFNGIIYYRLQGISAFGIRGDTNAIDSVRIVQPLECNSWIDSTNLVNNSRIHLFFHWPKNCDAQNLIGYDIYRSNQENGVYKKINGKIISKECTQFLDTLPNKNNFYKVIAKGAGTDSTQSFSTMAVLPDVHAPEKPKNIVARIDTNGRVHLQWQANRESDLKGYRIFRCNAQYEDVSEITKMIVSDTFYIDTVELKTLSKWVMYRLTAVDKVYNNSPYSNWVVVRRPDKIAPVAPVFKSIIQIDSSVLIKWNNSSSDDVWRYSLYRENENNKRDLIAGWFADDSLIEYYDTKALNKSYYRYTLRICDSSLNFSETKSAFFFKQAPKLLEAIQLNGEANRNEKNILLQWAAPKEKISRYVIYRKKENENWRIHKTVVGNAHSYKDTELNISNVYFYKIKAEAEDGRESVLGKEIKIIY